MRTGAQLSPVRPSGSDDASRSNTVTCMYRSQSISGVRREWERLCGFASDFPATAVGAVVSQPVPFSQVKGTRSSAAVTWCIAPGHGGTKLLGQLLDKKRCSRPRRTGRQAMHGCDVADDWCPSTVVRRGLTVVGVLRGRDPPRPHRPPAPSRPRPVRRRAWTGRSPWVTSPLGARTRPGPTSPARRRVERA